MLLSEGTVEEYVDSMNEVKEQEIERLKKVVQEKDEELSKVTQEKDEELTRITQEKDSEIARLKALLAAKENNYLAQQEKLSSRAGAGSARSN